MAARSTTSLAASLAERVKLERRCYRKQLKRCRRKFSEHAVHDLRIETRRLLALLDLLRALHLPGPIRKVRKIFKQQLDAFDGLRDTQVQLSLLRPLMRQFPEGRELKKRLCRHERRLSNELRAGVHATKSGRLERRLKSVEKQLRAAADELPPEAVRLAILAEVRAAFERVVALRGRIQQNRPATIHRTRVAFKRFRYLCELLRPALPELNDEKLARMHDYQTMMGDIQDAKVLLASMRRAITDREINVLAVGPLQRELRRRQRKLVDGYLAVADRLSDFEPRAVTPHRADPKLICRTTKP